MKVKMSNNKYDAWKEELDEIDYQNYEEAVKKIVQMARKITEAEVGALFLTAEGIFLEAAYWESESPSSPPQSPPASELPTYRLHWWEKEDKLFDGITAFVEVRQKVENLNQKEVFEHPAWKGKWDAVFLGGERTRCRGILAIPLQSKIGKEKNRSRVHGVLKVENPKASSPIGHFKSDHEEMLKLLAQEVATKLDNSPDFWRKFVKTRADLKISYIVELLERGRSINYNLSQSLGYVTKLFEKWLRSESAVHVFWRPGQIPKAHILHPWDFAAGDQPKHHIMMGGNDAEKRRNLTSELVRWIDARVGPKIVQPRLSISSDLWDNLFPNTPYQESVDIIRLKAGKYDLGAVMLPQSPLWKSIDSTAEENKDALEILTRLAMNAVSILGRFIEDEYETSIDTYLPEHRPPRVSKNCAILFADIKNFSQLIQILRLMGKPQLIEPFMDQFCAKMGKIISETSLGRVDKFLGDGVMALFGEDLDYPNEDYKKVVVAVDCAWNMLKQFEELYKTWVDEGLTFTDIPDRYPDENKTKVERLDDLRKRFNEDIQIDLTIGINMGEIYFDYFGYRTHREYTAIGDHVNFTQRIRGAAGRYDESERRILKNILISQTAHQFLRENGYLLKTREPVWLRFKGFGFAYPVYEIEYPDLNHTKIAQTLRNLEKKGQHIGFVIKDNV